MATRVTVRLCVWAGKDSGMNVNTDGNDSARGGTSARWLVLAAVAAAVIVVGFLAMAIYSTQLNARSDGTKRTPLPIAARAYAGEATETEGKSGEDGKAKDEPEGKAASGGSGQQAAASGSASSGTSASGSASSGGSGSSGTASPSGSSAASQPQRTWVEDTEQVWVVDSAAWDEQVPVYGQEEHTICNTCGADITGNVDAHAKQHHAAGEHMGWHSECVSVITGYDTVHHDETGHYETVAAGGHWE